MIVLVLKYTAYMTPITRCRDRFESLNQFPLTSTFRKVLRCSRNTSQGFTDVDGPDVAPGPSSSTQPK